jgi:hypothetical protein
MNSTLNVPLGTLSMVASFLQQPSNQRHYNRKKTKINQEKKTIGKTKSTLPYFQQIPTKFIIILSVHNVIQM